MKKIKALIAGVVLLASGFGASGFVMVGIADTNSSTVVGNVVQLNITDDMGGPKELKTFFRWNTPHLTYGFDQGFIQAFGVEGMEAIREAFRIMNDFFVPEDKSYVGVSSLDYARDGFLNNFNTAWENTTARNAQIIDMKSLMLGMLVNQLGVGNPHRYAFSIRNIVANNLNTQWNFGVTLRNYDPISWQPTDTINGVKYSYRLIHDANASLPLTAPSVADMEEFTTDTSGNAWTAVAGIADAFYGQTSIWWTDTPTLFDFGIYYDGLNAMGGQYQPRHALTYDDAGALKYLYRTNNFVMENIDANSTVITPPQLLPDQVNKHFRRQDNMWRRGNNDISGRLPHAWPRRGNPGVTTRIPMFLPNQSPFATYPILGRPVAQIGNNATRVDLAWRGGIDKIQFYELPYDSIMGRVFVQTNFFWTDIFVTDIGQTVYGLNNTTNGASTWTGPAQTQYYTQELARGVQTEPDIIIDAGNLGTTAGGVPIGWTRTPNSYTDNNASQPINMNNVNLTRGPGTIDLNATITYQFATLAGAGEEFSLIWSGEQSVVGNMDPLQGYYQMWGHIKGPGPNDVVVFSGKNLDLLIQNQVEPQNIVPVISMVSDDGGVSAISTNSLTRTEETLTIIGSGLGSGTAIEIMNGDLVVQTLFPVEKYLVSDLRIDIPVGVLTDLAEGTARTVRVWNTVGASLKSPQSFNIYTGRPIVSGTTQDGGFYDRAQALTVTGVGFKSAGLGPSDGGLKLSHFRVEDGQGNVLTPAAGLVTTAVTWDVVSDTKAVLPLNSLTQAMDGTYRRIRVSRDLAGLSLSVTNNTELITYVTTTPTITALTTDIAGTLTAVSTSVPLRRDASMDIVGTAMNTATAIELVKADGSSFTNPMVINLPDPGVTVDENGTRIQVSTDVIPYPDADGHTASQYRKFKVYNLVGNHTFSTLFNVNIQPTLLSYAGFIGTPKAFNYTPTGDDITLTGTGLMAVSSVQIVNEVAGALTGPVSIAVPSTGVTVTDTSIVIDTSAQQFGNVANAASTAVDAGTGLPTGDRRFSVLSARTTATTSATPAELFIVGKPPTYDSTLKLTGLGGFTDPYLDLERDTATGSIIFNGTGLSQITGFEIVDEAGSTIGAVPTIALSSARLTANATTATLTWATLAGVPEFAAFNYLLDDVNIASGDGRRRIKVTTPFGSVTSATTDGFTISAKPTFGLLADPVFAGGGYAAGPPTYTSDAAGVGDLLIHDTNPAAGLRAFNGVATITFENSNSDVFKTETVDPATTSIVGITFDPSGGLITISKAYLDTVVPGWVGSGGVADRRIRVETRMGVAAADTTREVVTPSIITAPTTTSTMTLADSGGYLHPNFDRSGVLTINAVTGTDFTSPLVTAVGLADATGTLIGTVTPVAPSAVAAGVITVNAGVLNAVWVAAQDQLADSYSSNRRLVLVRASGGNLTSGQAFTVADTGINVLLPDYGGVYLGSGGGVTGGTRTYTYSTDVGGIKINQAAGTDDDLNGVYKISFWNVTAGTAMAGTTDLYASLGDFTVDAAGDTISITKAIINSKGLAWYTPASGAGTRAFRVFIPGTGASAANTTTPVIAVAP
jgi:hypothetical protein